MNQVDRKTINILLAALDIEQHELGEMMGYDRRYLSNVFNGSLEARPAFRRAFGETLAILMLGTFVAVGSERYPAAPLLALIEKRAAQAASKRDFYRELGTSAEALRRRETLDGLLVDRVCCALGIHPSSVYGSDYEAVAEAS